jgi:hypothetical protein
MILSDANLTRISQGDLSFVYLLTKALESDYSSGFNNDRTPYWYMVQQLEAIHGADCVAVRRIRTMFATWGKLT